MIDTHCHIDDPVYQSALDEFLQTQKDAGVEYILVPGVNRESVETVKDVCSRYPHFLLPAIGLHPEDVTDEYEQDLLYMRQALFSGDTDYIAIGEIGLDYHFSTDYKREQQSALHTQLQWAMEKHLPVMIHSRDATDDCLRILSAYPALQGVMHCFSGSAETAQRIMDMGLYLGIGGVITFKNCRLKDNLTNIPLERLVLETDAPYMTPVPFRGQTNESRYMIYVAQTLAEVYHCTTDEIISATTENAKRLFNIK